LELERFERKFSAADRRIIFVSESICRLLALQRHFRSTALVFDE
jgi:hypothetical protein